MNMKNSAGACPHYWLIAAPGGPTSDGVCKWCGASQVFPNSSSTSGWEKDVPAEREGANEKGSFRVS